MSAKANLVNEPTKIVSGIDSVVIRQYNSGITGGRTLDMTDFKEEVIKAGHLVIRTPDEDNKEYIYKPMPVEDGAYKDLPEKHEYVGVVVCSKPSNEPLVGIMDDGRVNDKSMPYPFKEAMEKAVKAALPSLIFEHD